MNFSRMGAQRARKCALLMGSTSLFTIIGLAGASAQKLPASPAQSQTTEQVHQVAEAQPTQEPRATGETQIAQARTLPADVAQALTQAPEQVLVTGSLIHGTAAVGVPVTSFRQGDFANTGSLTIADLFKNVPAVYQIPQNDVIAGGGYIARGQNVNLRNLSMRNSRQLLLVDGMRFPNQGRGGCQTDPSIIPQLAVDHVDLLTDGASATYGSDAITGVINVILKRGYNGALSQLQFSTAPGVGGHNREMASQLFGRTWDGGDVTVSYEWYRQDHTKGAVRPYFTQDFLTFQGLDDRRNIINSDPGIISTGNPTAPANTPTGFAANLGQTCINCYSIPKGQNGVGLTWAQIAGNPGVHNQRNLWQDGWTEPEQQRTAATLTFDQRVTKDISFFADAWESNRQALFHGQAAGNSVSVTVPTSNPYYPVGYPGPGALTVAYDLNLDLLQPDRVTSSEFAARYDAGFNFDLPWNWIGRVYGGQTKIHEKDSTTGTVNLNMVKAAVGQTIAAVPANGATPFIIPSFTKPANIPYLNLFCDPNQFVCNDPATLDYITGYSLNDENIIINEYGTRLDGPIYELPGGTLKAAAGAVYDHFSFYTATHASNANNALVASDTFTSARRNIYSFFGQIHIPILGNDFKFPLMEGFDVEASIRYDRYSDFGSTTNPKIAFNWTVGYGVTLRGSWGTAFRAPSFQEATTSGPGTINQVQGQGSNTILTCPQNAVGQPAKPGSIAALIDPNCSPALQFLAGLSSGYNPDVRPAGFKLQPETAQNLSAGFEFAPDYKFLKGLDIQGTYWYIHIRNVLNNYFGVAGLQSGQLDDPNWAKAFLTPANDPNFAQHVATLLNGNKSTLPATFASSIAFIADTGNRNVGWQAVDGVDFNISYDFDLGKWGAWNTGVTGTYVLDNKSQGGPGQAILSVYHSALSPTAPNAVDTGGTLKYRARLGWVSDAGWNVTGFMNFIPHFNSDTQQLPPACFQIGNAPCNASGLPQFAQYTQQYQLLTNVVPGLYTFDLSLGYDTGDRPENEYLRNIAVQINFTNILDKQAPYAYQINPPGGAQGHAYYSTTQGTSLGIDGRVIGIILTKSW